MPLFAYDTVLAEVQEAMKQLLRPVPIGVYDSSVKSAVLMGSFINNIGQELVDNFIWQQLEKTFTVNGDGADVDFALPSDIARFTADTGWSTTNRRPVLFTTAQTWAEVDAWASGSFTIRPMARVWDDTLYFQTAPASGETITFKYISRNWVKDADNPTTLKETCSKNGDTPMFDRLLMILALKLKWGESRGMDTTRWQNDFDTRIASMTQKNKTGSPTLSLNGGLGSSYLLGGHSLPDTGFGS